MENLEILIKQIQKQKVALDIAQDFLAQLSMSELTELTAQYNRMIGDN